MSKKAMLALISVLVMAASTTIIPLPVHATYVENFWAVIINGDTPDFQIDAEHMYNVLTAHYSFDDIMYLSTDTSQTGVDLYADKENAVWTLNDWLGSVSDEDDLIFIFVATHGCRVWKRWHIPGDPVRYHYTNENGRFEIGGDEWEELTELDLNMDVDGVGGISNDTWVGVDEGISLSNGAEVLWDDEVRDCLNALSYRRLVFVFSTGAANPENRTCFSGGFIRDISAPRRIIISCTNETHWSPAEKISEVPYRLEGYWSREFINALDPSNPAFELADLYHQPDGAVSIYEAYMYAWYHDYARRDVRTQWGAIPDPWINDPEHQPWWWMDETPWMSDVGNGDPDFRRREDHPNDVKDREGMGDHAYVGSLSKYTWLDRQRYSGYWTEDHTDAKCDINDDRKVDTKDLAIASKSFAGSCEYWGEVEGWWCHERWNPIADINQDNMVDIRDIALIAKNYGKTW